MMMGIGLAVVTLGAILRYAIESTGDEFDLPTVGLILMVVGGIAFLTGAGLEFMKRRAALPHPMQPPGGASGYAPPPAYPPPHSPAGAPPAYQPPQPPAGAPPSYPPPPAAPPAYKPPPPYQPPPAQPPYGQPPKPPHMG